MSFQWYGTFPISVGGYVANVSECIENVFECILTFRNALH